MKNRCLIPFICLISLLSIIFTACDSGKPSISGYVTITGRFSSGSDTRAPGVTNREAFETIRVLVFDTSGNYVETTIMNGQFVIEVPTGAPVGMIFVGSTDNLLGYLSLGDGIESIPLVNMEEGVSTIDLGELTFTGGVFEPSNNPLDDVFALTEDETRSLALFNNTFAAVVQNPDTDGNGTIDLLEGIFYFTRFAYNINMIRGGIISNDLITTTVFPAIIDSYLYNLIVFNYPGAYPNQVFFTGPEGSGLTNSPSLLDIGAISYFDAGYASPFDLQVPLSGTYTIEFLDKTLSFNLDTSSAQDIIILTEPFVILNDDGTIHKIKFANTFSDAKNGELLCYKGSNSTLEIAANLASAKDIINVNIGDHITIEK